QIAAFNLALAAWKRIGHRKLPPLHLACSGLSPGVSKEEWLKLAEQAALESPVPPDADLLGVKQNNLFSDATRRGFERLYDLFAKAPVLGSLIQPRAEGDLIETGFADLEPLLAKVLARSGSEELAEMAVTAQGLAKAAQILAERFTLVATNVPYLGRGKQEDVLKNYCERAHPAAKADLATCFVERCLAFCKDGGSTALVTPQNWLFLGTYKHLRKRLLEEIEWNAVARLGEHGFDSPQAAGAFTALLVLTQRTARDASVFGGVDVSENPTPQEKDTKIRACNVYALMQSQQVKNPDSILTFDVVDTSKLLGRFAECFQGISPGD